MGSAGSGAARSIAVIGTGAVGGFYGSRLHAAGFEVHFLLHSDYEQVARDGLVVTSPWGDVTVKDAAFYASATTMPPSDVVLVALKTTQNHLLQELLPPLVGPDTTVVMLQNGLGVEAQAAEVVGDDRVLGGMCFLCSNKVGPGRIEHLDYGLITLAQFTPEKWYPGTHDTSSIRAVGITDRVRAVGADLEHAGIPVQLEPDLVTARWKKLCWNIPFNGLSVVLDATTDELMDNAASRELARDLMQEVRVGATACGADIPEAFAVQMFESTSAMKPYLTSMKLDYDAGRPMEIEAIFGRPLRSAAERGVHLPRIEALCRQLQFVDARNAAATWQPAAGL